MATAIIASDHRRCDATCHRAEGADCRCICNGRYHGKGQIVPTDEERREFEAQGYTFLDIQTETRSRCRA